MSDDLRKISEEIHKAQEEAKRTSDLNYHRFNKFIVEKGIDRNKVLKNNKNVEVNKRIEKAADEAAKSIHHILRQRKYYS